MSLDTHGGSETDYVYSVYSSPLDSESGHSSDNLECYDTPICGASPTPPSAPSMPPIPKMPPPRSGSPRSKPFSELGCQGCTAWYLLICSRGLCHVVGYCVRNDGLSNTRYDLDQAHSNDVGIFLATLTY